MYSIFFLPKKRKSYVEKTEKLLILCCGGNFADHNGENHFLVAGRTKKKYAPTCLRFLRITRILLENVKFS